MPHPTHQHVFLVLPFYIIQNPAPRHLYHYHQNHHPLPIRPHYLSPGFLRLPLSGFPSSTFVPLYFIFCAAASVLLLKFIKLRLFSVHTPPLASLFCSEWNTKCSLWSLTLPTSTSPTLVNITMLPSYIKCASTSGPLHLLSPCLYHSSTGQSLWFTVSHFSALCLEFTLAGGSSLLKSI